MSPCELVCARSSSTMWVWLLTRLRTQCAKCSAPTAFLACTVIITGERGSDAFSVSLRRSSLARPSCIHLGQLFADVHTDPRPTVAFRSQRWARGKPPAPQPFATDAPMTVTCSCLPRTSASTPFLQPVHDMSPCPLCPPCHCSGRLPISSSIRCANAVSGMRSLPRYRDSRPTDQGPARRGSAVATQVGTVQEAVRVGLSVVQEALVALLNLVPQPRSG
eukprot:scaffold12534_cov157-Isochrysis_galbana.AAC.1